MFASPSPSLRRSLGAATIGGVSLLAVAFPAAGQQVASGQQDKAAYLAAKCDHLYSKPPEHAGCYAQEALNFERARAAAAVRRGVEADRRGAEADRRGAEADRQSEVLSGILECDKFLRSGGFTREKVVELAGGRVTQDNICEVARKLGFTGRKAALEAPSR